SRTRFVAIAQRDDSDDGDRVRLRGDHGGVSVLHRYDAGVDREASDRAGGVMSARPAEGNKKWFVVHAYSGFEKSVQRALTERIKRSDIADQFGQILVPVEEVVEMKAGAK